MSQNCPIFTEKKMNVNWDEVDAAINALTDEDIERIARELSAEMNETDRICRESFKNIHFIDKL
jgi:hypothetical protein